jgi:hypothetical protein
MSRIPETKPGHLAQFGPLNHPRRPQGSQKGGSAYQFRKTIKEAPAPQLGWRSPQMQHQAKIMDGIERVMERIDASGCSVAVFWIDGVLSCRKQTSSNYNEFLSKRGDALVGVYKPGVRASDVMDDLRALTGAV